MNEMQIIYRFYLPLTIWIASLLFLTHMRKKTFFWLRILMCYLCLVMVHYVFSQALTGVVRDVASFTCMLLVTIPALKLCYSITWSDCIFCSVAGYSIQHIASLIANIFINCICYYYPPLLGHSAFYFCSRLFTTCLIYACAFAIFGNRMRVGQDMSLKKLPALLLLTAVTLVEIILSSFTYDQANKYMLNMYYFSSMFTNTACSIAFLVIQFSLLNNRSLEYELDVLQQLRQKEQIQYRFSKEIIDTVNRKCHDMRHQIHTIGRSAKIDPTALEEMEGTIRIYDALYQTGNKALDIILAEKILLCQDNNIEIHCMADGEKLGFMSDTDIYSLFGNLLDNAIHAIQPLEPELRTIGLSVVCHGTLLSINSHNRYSGEVIFEDGVPVTASTDIMNRGFGVKSITMIVEKYGGTVSFQAKDGIFNLNILFPLDGDS